MQSMTVCMLHAGYAFLASPNQTPYRDMYFLEKLSGLGVNDGVAINTVFTQLFFVMGIWPAIYAALLIPSARSATKASSAPIAHLLARETHAVCIQLWLATALHVP